MNYLIIAAAAALLAGPASGAIYDVTLTKFGETPLPPGWVETDMTGDVIAAYFEVDAITYDVPRSAFVGEALGTTFVFGHIVSGPVTANPIPSLTLDATGNPLNLRWSLSTCSTTSCGGGTFAGTYRIEERDAPPVPLPAAGWLLSGALGALLLRRRRR